MPDSAQPPVAPSWTLDTSTHFKQGHLMLFCQLAGSQDMQSRWLLAQCCMSMNKYTEAEQALNPNNDGTDVCTMLSTSACFVISMMCKLLCSHEVHVLNSRRQNHDNSLMWHTCNVSAIWQYQVHGETTCSRHVRQSLHLKRHRTSVKDKLAWCPAAGAKWCSWLLLAGKNLPPDQSA